MIEIVIGGKGGLGVSLITKQFAESSSERSLLIDSSFSRRGQDLLVDIENYPAFDLYDYINEICKLEDCIISTTNYDLILPSQTKTIEVIDKSIFENKILEIKEYYNIIYIDLSHWSLNDLNYWLKICDKINLVTSSNLESLRGVDQVLFTLKKLHLIRDCRLIFNFVRTTEEENMLVNWAKKQDIQIFGTIEYLMSKESISSQDLIIQSIGKIKDDITPSKNFLKRLFQ